MLHTFALVAASSSQLTFSASLRKKFSMADRTRDYINELNTVGQLHRKRVQYEYTKEGPQHDERWFATVYLDEVAWATGTGRTKRGAQADAARSAIELVEQGY